MDPIVKRLGMSLGTIALLGLCLWLVRLAGRDSDQGVNEPVDEPATEGIAMAQEPHLIRPGETIEREMAAGETHSYGLDLEADHFVHVIADQKGIDVAVKLLDPDGEVMIRVDSPIGAYGTEELFAIAPVKDRYRLEVESEKADVAPGNYSLTIRPLREPDDTDRDFVTADHAFYAAKDLRKEGRASAPQAIKSGEKALEIWQRLGERTRQAETLHELGRAHKDLGELRPALDSHRQAAEIFRALDNRPRLARMLQSMGVLHLRLGEAYQAMEHLDEALKLFKALEDEGGAALVLNRLGTAYNQIGQFQRAVEHFELALRKSEAAAKERLKATILIDMGAALLFLDRTTEALEKYNEAMEISERLDLSRWIDAALKGLANTAIQREEFQAAEDYIERSIERLRGRDDPRGRAVALNTLGIVLLKQSDIERARAAFEEALRIARESDEPHNEAMILMNTARLHLETGGPERALELYDQASEPSRSTGDPKGEASSRTGSARALSELGRRREAHERVTAALERVESLRTIPERRDVRTTYFAFRQDYYETAFDILMLLHKEDPSAGYDAQAFDVNERRLARELLDVLAETRTDLREAADPALLDQERALQQRLNKLVAATTPSADREEQIADLVAELNRVRGEIRKTSPRFAELKPPEPLSVAEVQRTLLDEESLLLVYALGDERSYLWSVSRQGLTGYELDPRGKIESIAEDFAKLLPQTKPARQKSRARLGSELSECLLAPVRAELDHQRLIIVTEGALQSVPFAALPDPNAESSDQPLILNHEIVTVPSISVIASLRQARGERPAPTQAIAAIADPVFEVDDSRVRQSGKNPAATETPADATPLWRQDLQRSADDLGLTHSDRLPQSRLEAAAILELVPEEQRRFVVDFDANRKIVASGELSGYSILHFATHALLHRKHPELSGLVLSLVDEQGHPQDGFLRTHEISSLELPAELVALSACETGLGKDVRGEGLLGLARGFLQAGALRVVVSLWKISDVRTADLMSRFYRAYLEDGLSPGAALRHAQISMLHDTDTADPYFWAGFILQGEWR